MLDQLRRNVAAIGATNVDVDHGDGQALPFDENSFDIGVSMFGLMFFPDRAKGFAELHRVLVPGGQVLVSSWAPSDQSPLMRTVFAALQPDDAPPQPMGRLSGLEDRDLFETEMRAAGFADIHIEPVTHGLEVDDVDRFWEETVRAMAPITLLKHNSSSEEWTRIEARALDRLRAALPDLPTELGATAYLAVGRKPEHAS
jgi:SAM-dependent methyltransferase